MLFLSDENKIHIVKEGGLKPLIELLESSNNFFNLFQNKFCR